ncbi:MAG: cytochrome c oxidase subunit II [Hydrotalea sp.]|nr:cytochrome c oxidase subunit II [Hydrotalea sp.]
MRKIFFALLSLAGLLGIIAQPAMAQDAGNQWGNASPWQMNMGGAASQVAEQVQWFHNWVLMPVIVFICLFVLVLLFIIIFRFSEKKNPVPSKIAHNTPLEIVWTAVPLLILGLMFIPSIKILYFMESTGKSDMTVKITGHQWYWSYEYADVKDYGGEDGNPVKYDSIIAPEDSLPDDQKSLYKLKVDKALYIPVNKRVKMILTSQDVMHSFSVLPLGLKMDAVPGRNNETWVNATQPGIYYGFCTELCGANHAYMPIEIHVVSDSEFQDWLKSQSGAPAAPDANNNKKAS